MPSMHAGPSRRTALLASLSVCALPNLPAHSEVGWTPLQKMSVRVQRSALRTVESEYSTQFSAYLARILITWEPVTRRFWEDRQREGDAFEMDAQVYGRARELGTERRDEYLAARFSSLVTSVEVGLENFEGRQGASKLAASLTARYTSAPQKRALAQLLAMIEPPQQPTEAIAALVGEADQAKLLSLRLETPGGGYGPTPPEVTVAPPPTSSGRAARAAVQMAPAGRWRDVRVRDGGSGYAEGEVVRVEAAPPAEAGGVRARVHAVVRNGSVAELVLLEAGAGYSAAELEGEAGPRLRIAPPAQAGQGGGPPRRATGVLLPEYAVASVELLEAGGGYNADEPPAVTIAPPPPLEGAPAAAAAKGARASATLSARPGAALSAIELAELERALLRAATAELEGFGPRLLPPSLVPARRERSRGERADASAAFQLGVRVPAGAFGVRAPAPVERLSPLERAETAKIFLAGGLCSASAHTLLVPLDVVKTRLQTEPGRYAGPLACAATVYRDEGAAAFAQGAASTLVGYLVAGSLSFGLFEVFSRSPQSQPPSQPQPQPPSPSPSPSLNEAKPEPEPELVQVFSRAVAEVAGAGNALFFATPLLALASVLATCVCATALCPFEAVRILSVRAGESSAAALQAQVEAEGPLSLFRGLPALLIKEVPFVVTKFIVFDRVSALILATAPELCEQPAFAATLPFVAGSVAGVASVLASQPADVVLTRTNDEGATLGGAIADLRASPRLALQGLAPRLLFGVLLVTLQFVLYTQLRASLGVAKTDLTLVWDALSVLRVVGQ